MFVAVNTNSPAVARVRIHRYQRRAEHFERLALGSWIAFSAALLAAVINSPLF